MQVRLKSVYDEPDQSDGQRILVDRLWPRGISRERLKIGAWLKELAPSDELRKWFRHDPEKWEEFRRRYFDELTERPEAVAAVLAQVREEEVTLIFAARDREHNNAVALRDFLMGKLVRQQ